VGDGPRLTETLPSSFSLRCDPFTLALYLAFLFQFDFSATINYPVLVGEVLPFFVAVKLVFLFMFRVYGITWRYVGMGDLVNLTMALVLAELLLAVLSLPPVHSTPSGDKHLPKRIIFLDGLISLLMLMGLGISKRFYLGNSPADRACFPGKNDPDCGCGIRAR
jgi:UDP-N-acetyl-D-glucosamine 4,6-dehydratase